MSKIGKCVHCRFGYIITFMYLLVYCQTDRIGDTRKIIFIWYLYFFTFVSVEIIVHLFSVNVRLDHQTRALLSHFVRGKRQEKRRRRRKAIS